MAFVLRADGVDFNELFRTQETIGDQTTVNQLSARIICRRNEIATAEPDVSEPTASLLAAGLQDFLATNR